MNECRYPGSIRSRTLSILAISLRTDKLLMNPNWALLLVLLTLLAILIIIMLVLGLRLVFHPWKPIQSVDITSSRMGVHKFLRKVLCGLLRDEPRKSITVTSSLNATTEGLTDIRHHKIRDDGVQNEVGVNEAWF